MALDPVTLVPLIIIAGATLFGGKKKKTKSKKKLPPPVQVCPPFTLDPDKVVAQADAAVTAGMKGVDRISVYIASTLYPADQNAKPIGWPSSPPWELPAGTPEPVLCLLGEIKSIVSDLDVPPDDVDDPTPGEILTDLLSSTPAPGRFSLVKQGNVALGANGLVAQLLNKVSPGAGSNNAHRLAYLKLMTGKPGDWNFDKYGRTTTTDNWPAYTMSNGRNLGAAFLPRHKNAIAAITNGQDPERNITLTGAKVGEGSSYALLWYPPIDKASLENLGVVTSAGLTWPDSSPVANPPPELLSKLS